MWAAAHKARRIRHRTCVNRIGTSAEYRGNGHGLVPAGIRARSRFSLAPPDIPAKNTIAAATYGVVTFSFVTYQTHYRIVASERHFAAASKIRFTTRERLAAMLDHVSLEVDEWLGDWKEGAYEPTSREIIPVGRPL